MSFPLGSDRRDAPRHPVTADAHVMKAGRSWPVHLLDMSSNGARLAIQNGGALQPGDDVSLTVELEEGREPDVTPMTTRKARKLLRLRGTLIYREDTGTGIEDSRVGIEYRPLSEFDQVLLTLLLARP